MKCAGFRPLGLSQRPWPKDHGERPLHRDEQRYAKRANSGPPNNRFSGRLFTTDIPAFLPVQAGLNRFSEDCYRSGFACYADSGGRTAAGSDIDEMGHSAALRLCAP